MNHFVTIFRKELTDTIRDRRTCFSAVLFPLLLVPLMLTIVTKLQTSWMKKAEEKTIRVGLVANGGRGRARTGPAPGARLAGHPGNPGRQRGSADQQRQPRCGDRRCAGDFDTEVNQMQTGTIRLFYKSSDDYGHGQTAPEPAARGFREILTSPRLHEAESGREYRQARPAGRARCRIDEGKDGEGGRRDGAVFLRDLLLHGSDVSGHRPGGGRKRAGNDGDASDRARQQVSDPAREISPLSSWQGFSAPGSSMLGIFVAVRQVKEIPPEHHGGHPGDPRRADDPARRCRSSCRWRCSSRRSSFPCPSSRSPTRKRRA